MLNISVGGDVEGGYLVDVHDGDKHGVYRPDGIKDDQSALAAALKEHDPELQARLAKAMGGDPDDAKKIADLTAENKALTGKISELTADVTGFMRERDEAGTRIAALTHDLEVARRPAPPPPPPRANDDKHEA
jgi:hypothetical protein